MKLYINEENCKVISMGKPNGEVTEAVVKVTNGDIPKIDDVVRVVKDDSTNQTVTVRAFAEGAEDTFIADDYVPPMMPFVI